MSEETVTEPEIKAKKQNAIEVKPMQLDSNSQIVVRDTSELMRMIQQFMQGQAFPKSFDTPQKCIAAWNLAASFKNYSPQRAIARMMFINGTIAIWGELPYALAEATGEVSDYQLYVVDKDYNEIKVENKNLHVDPYAAICKIKRGTKTANEFYFTVDEAEHAGLLKKSGPWQQYAKTMMMWRASHQALKFVFGDALMGAELAESAYTKEFARENGFKDVTPIDEPSKADILNSKFTSGFSQVSGGESVDVVAQ